MLEGDRDAEVSRLASPVSQASRLSLGDILFGLLECLTESGEAEIVSYCFALIC